MLGALLLFVGTNDQTTPWEKGGNVASSEVASHGFCPSGLFSRLTAIIADPAVLADMSAKLRKDGTMNLQDLKGLSEEDMKASVAALNLKPVQFNKLFKAVSNL